MGEPWSTGHKMGPCVLVLDRDTEKAYTLHTACLENLRGLLGDDRARLVEMSPASTDDECGHVNCLERAS